MTPRLLTALILSALSLAPTAVAEGLLQVRFGGWVSGVLPGADPASDPESALAVGQLVEVEIGAVVADGPRDLILHLHLAPGTTGVELADLVASRLMSLGVKGVVTPGSGNLWIEDATHIHLRLGGGLHAQIALAEGPPVSLSVRPPTQRATAQILTVDVTTVIRPSGGLPVRGTAALAVPLAKDSSAASISAALMRAGQSKWISDRPKGDAWSPVRMKNGAAITGFSLSLGAGHGDWRVELSL